DFWAPGLGPDAYPREEGFADAADLRATLTEQRGPFTFTVMRGPEGQFADCILESRWGSQGSGAGSTTPAPPTPDPAPDQVDTATLGAVGPSTRTILGITLPQDRQVRSYAYGRAGADVTAVT